MKDFKDGWHSASMETKIFAVVIGGVKWTFICQSFVIIVGVVLTSLQHIFDMVN